MDTAPTARSGALAAFRIRSFRYQWTSDLLTSWSFEMEFLILGWYVLVATDSALVLGALGALHFGGTLLSPLFGVVADRVDRRTMLLVMRLAYGVLALCIMLLGLRGIVVTWQLFAIVAVSGLLRPSDMVVRHSLIADTVPADQLRNALGLSRTVMDSARIAGALLGAGLLSNLGLGLAYGAVTGFYLSGALLVLGIAARGNVPARTARPLAELRLGFAYLRRSEALVGIMSLAFLVNLSAYPISHGLLPVLARDVYGVDANGLARLVAAYASGALLGSIASAAFFRGNRPGRVMVLNAVAWHLLLAGLGLTGSTFVGMGVLVAVGACQSFAMITMSVLLLSITDPAYRGRVMGVRMLAVYGLPLGLLAGGTLLEWTSVPITFAGFGLCGALAAVAISLRWPVLMRL